MNASLRLGLAAAVSLALASVSEAQTVLISELADPRLNYQSDRFIEIYNSGPGATDLTGWTLVAVGNGADIFTWNLSGSIAPGQALVAGDLTLAESFPVDFPAEAWSTSNGTWNGKAGDGAKLLNASATVVDHAVVDGTHFENDDYVRDAAAPSVTYNVAEWMAAPIDLPTEGTPGTHGSGVQSPTISSIQTSPTDPEAGEAVSISAIIVEPVESLTAAEVHWGTVSTSLTNTIAMTVIAGDGWGTVGAIPGQSAGTTVYFEIEAFNDAPASTVSPLQSYALTGLYDPPAGYYTSAEGLDGVALRSALHNIIDNHTVISYGNTLNVFVTSDDKPNGKVWDMYSDVPGGTPPYEYDFGETGSSAGGEGEGYNREHSWPRSWFGGAVSPMNSDLFQLYPSDIYVNSIRGSFPYGEVSVPNYTAQNGGKRGPNTYPGYAGIVFEPIDAFKGDFARSYFYMTARYYTEDGAWPSSDMTDGADLKPWAEAMLYEWHVADPVSDKERERNHVVYGAQDNRNPFIDRPEFVAAMFGITTVVEFDPATVFQLRPNAPNPFSTSTSIGFSLGRSGPVSLVIYDVRGRRVRDLVTGQQTAGLHILNWNGRDSSGNPVASGTYYYRLQAGGLVDTRPLVLVR